VFNAWGDGYYTFEVEYENNHVVPYTTEGYPAWNTGKLDFQTVFYKEDIDSFNYDISGVTNKNITPKKIIKLRLKSKLLVKCPSGIWMNSTKCPSQVMEQYLEDGMLNMFKKA